ncbi:MAG TPA: hypothetical protein VFB01_09210 [Burkholderiales bacterium]|nr:hypothetical protein [Burkholderiales bacterium]
MNKLLTILGGLLFAGFIIAIAAAAATARWGNMLDADSKAYADNAIPALASGWDVQELQKRASPELFASTSSDQLRGLFGNFQRLGRLTKYSGANGEATISVTSKDGLTILAAYVADAEFEHGPARIELNLIRHDTKWQVLGLRIQSNLLLN